MLIAHDLVTVSCISIAISQYNINRTHGKIQKLEYLFLNELYSSKISNIVFETIFKKQYCIQNAFKA
jgi:hypothetical protein